MAFRRSSSRSSSIPHAPYYDTESFGVYQEMMGQATSEEEKKAIEDSLRKTGR
jgi:hypothetical protein